MGQGLQIRPTLLLIAVMSTPAAARGGTAALVVAEDGYTRAVSGPNLAALGATLSADLVYVHASGQAQGKQEYLETTREGGFAVRSARVVTRQAEVHGRIGITQGVIAYDVGHGGNPARYMAVYRKEGGRWLLLRWQNTRMASSRP